MKGDDLDRALKLMERYVEKLKVKNENLKKEREIPLKVRNAIKYAVMNEAPIRKPTTLGDVTVETSLYPIEDSFKVGIHDKISVKHRLKRSEMTKYVCNGAELECPHLDGGLELKIYNKKVMFQNHEQVATSEDHLKENFEIVAGSGTGICSKTQKECLKCIDAYWEEETLAPYVFTNEARVVLKTSILKCKIDESIKIKVRKSGQDFGIFQGFKNKILNFHDKNPWLIRVYDGLFNQVEAIGTEIVAGGMFSIGFLPFAIELDQSAREDFLAGFDQIDKGMLASPIGTDYKKDLEISKLARKLVFGNYNIEDKEKNIINETLDDVKDNFFELSEEERENEIIKNSTTAPKKFGIKLAKESIKSITTDKIVENRRPLYNWINQKTNALQLFVPTKEWSDSTVEFLEDPYVTVIIESKKTID